MKSLHCCLLALTLNAAWTAADPGTVNAAGRPLLPRTSTAPMGFSSAQLAFSASHPAASRRSEVVNHRNRDATLYPRIYNAPKRYTEKDLKEECLEDDCLLTPQTYAISDEAEHKVEDNIINKASSAFASTDFEHEPHLSPELENVETAYEVAMMANAAHAFADAAEKESRQSLAAMMEREKEIEWIQNHNDGEGSGDPFFLSPKKDLAERTQRALLEARLDMEKKANVAAARAKEQNQRDLLETRLMMERKSKDAEEIEMRSEWMESEALAATMGGHELNFNIGLASAAASSATTQASAPAGSEMLLDEIEETLESASSVLAETAERMILGDDIALDIALIEDAEEHEKYEETTVEPTVQSQASEVNRWRQDYVQDIISTIQKKSIEQTKNKISQRVDAVEVSTADTAASSRDTAAEKPGTTIASFKSENSAIKRALEKGLVRRMQQRKRLIITALVMVLTRRLVLAWFGNGLRLI